MTWQKGREKYGKIKNGQRWQKKDTGRQMTITGKSSKWGGAFRVLFDSGTKSHVIKMRDIYYYYNKLD